MEARNLFQWFKENKRNALIMFAFGAFSSVERYSLSYLFTKYFVQATPRFELLKDSQGLYLNFQPIQIPSILDNICRFFGNILTDFFGAWGINVKF